LIQLQLADVPLDADVANPEGRPLGSPEEVAERLIELLPGAQFDDSGRGSFKRSGYQIAFKLHGNPTTAIGVAFDDGSAFTAIKRLVEKTGWCVMDPVAKALVDIDASRLAGKTISVGEAVAAETSASSPSAGKLRLFITGRSLRTPLIVTAAFVTAAAVGIEFRDSLSERLPVRLPASITTPQRASGARFERYNDRVRRRNSVMKALPAAFRDNRIVEQLVDVQMASRAYWNFVDGRFSSPELLSNADVWSRFHMQPFLPPAFGVRQRDGYEFEFSGQYCEEPDPGWPECSGFVYVARPLNTESEPFVIYALFSADDRIHFRKDGLLPTKTDPTVDVR
jgi:hypothetical protein